MSDIPKIVITGGPCAGKTSAMSKLKDFLVKHGFTPIFPPETATIMINSGIFPGVNCVGNLDFQEAILKVMLAIEDAQELIAKQQLQKGLKPVLILDRGALDSLAYMSGPEEFDQVVEKLGYKRNELRDGRYTGVIHMETAARGAEEYYTLDNNTARSESLDEARLLDVKTMNAWVGTPHLAVINNVPGQTFEQKLDRVIASVSRVLGIPVPLEIERKWTLADFPIVLPVHHQTVTIQQTYLLNSEDGASERVRSRTASDGFVLYTHTVKKHIDSGSNNEYEETISAARYNEYLRSADPERTVIIKTRVCFVYKHQYFELDVFIHPQDVTLLELEVLKIDDPVELPKFLGTLTEVTGDPRYSNHSLAAE